MTTFAKKTWLSIAIGAACALWLQYGCFSPDYGAGKIACGANDLCPPGFECNSADRCVQIGTGGQLDSGVPSDATGTDSPIPQCEQNVCSAVGGQCDGLVCVLSCTSATPCVNVTCPANHSCRFDCGRNGCDNLNCAMADQCTVNCTESNACKNDITCGTGPCTVKCGPENACPGNVNCQNSCACSVTCGDDACSNAAICPGTGNVCKANSGCTITAPGCNTCTM